MRGPSDDVRTRVTADIATLTSEDQIEDLLTWIAGQVAEDMEAGDDPTEDLAAIDSWAALASHAVASFYAPASPWPGRKLAGWSKKAATELRKIANALLGALTGVANALGASSWSIGVSFPWGVSIGLTWP